MFGEGRTRTVRFSILAACLGFSLTAATTAVLLPGSQQEPRNSSSVALVDDGAGNREAVWEGRYQAALAAKAAEDGRVREAISSYEDDRRSPSRKHDYIVSFQAPTDSSDILDAAAALHIEIGDVFTWIEDDPSSIYVGTGRHEVSRLGWSSDEAGSERVHDALLAFYRDRLGLQLTNIDRARDQTADASGRAAADRQRSAVAAQKSRVDNGELPLYGLSCSCSTEQLDALDAAVQSLNIRTVERGVTGPIWPRDAVRDLVIETRGKYGR